MSGLGMAAEAFDWLAEAGDRDAERGRHQWQVMLSVLQEKLNELSADTPSTDPWHVYFERLAEVAGGPADLEAKRVVVEGYMRVLAERDEHLQESLGHGSPSMLTFRSPGELAAALREAR